MSSRTRVVLLTLFSGAWAASPAGATPDSGYGVRVEAGGYESLDFGFTALPAVDGGEFTAFAEADREIFGLRGEATAFYEEGLGFLPRLTASAETVAAPGDRLASAATGIQGFRFDGQGPTELVIDYQLSGDVTQGSNAESFIGADVFVYLGYDVAFTSLLNLRTEEVPAEDRLAESVRTLTASGSISDQLRFLILPGEDFYVAAELVASAERGGVADARSTLTLSFEDTTDLIAALPLSIPEPASGAALLLAGAGLLRRRQAER
ncbi:PEP-CTERM sorting domain-containing protein [Phycisphaera mikurensis]|uniref:PEP-CTERM protein-sorting domain-containing protein n=1 Tax=Phycisphaera mikurensis (strain NBRC 102666 / KCTC 22515 / FYK2301M01) TaxID=1142394 RepID=I0IAU4_PHYMF|nr:PEP-CTERM sorting domain-containing protein [Phycisphaera mikurensis]MBB6442643.1 hypothetical protein [Phycisphaera mikurensis]BAM02382.1 hypothetical protein PSMK_02230 [Phycisphaera mikurensis NBRC 102666]